MSCGQVLQMLPRLLRVPGGVQRFEHMCCLDAMNLADNAVAMPTGLAGEDWLVCTVRMELTSFARCRKAMAEVWIGRRRSAYGRLIVALELVIVKNCPDLAIFEDFGTLRAANLIPSFVLDLVVDPAAVARATSFMVVLMR